MGAIASLITRLTIVYSTVYSDADQRKHQSSARLAIEWGIHYPAQMASNAENVSILWRHHGGMKLSLEMSSMNSVRLVRRKQVSEPFGHTMPIQSSLSFATGCIYTLKIALLGNVLYFWLLKVRFTTYISSDTICNCFSIHKDHMYRELIVGIEKVNAIIISRHLFGSLNVSPFQKVFPVQHVQTLQDHVILKTMLISMHSVLLTILLNMHLV